MSSLQNYAEENKYDLLSKFESLKEFNDHFEQTMLLHKGKFTKSEHLALNKLRKFAADILGVAWCRIQKAVSATHKDEMFGISRSTFERMLRKAKKLNLITVINQKNKHNYKKHNVYRFNRLEELTPEAFETVRIVSESQTIDVFQDTKIDATRTLLLKLPKLKDYKTYPQAESVACKEESNLINFKENKTEYQQLKEMLSGLFTDKKTTYRVYGVWMSQTKNMINKPPFELAIKAVRALVREVKRRIASDLAPLQNPAGYFNGIVSNLINQWLDSEMKRYAENWEAAMIEDGSAYENNVENDSKTTKVDDVLTPEMDITLSRYNYFTQYIEAKKREISFADVNLERYTNRMKRLLKFEELLNKYNVLIPLYDWINDNSEELQRNA